MPMRSLYFIKLLLFLVFLPGPLLTHGAELSCNSVFVQPLAIEKPTAHPGAVYYPSYEDLLIRERIGDLNLSYSFQAQSPADIKSYNKALQILREDPSFTIESIQLAHQALTDGKAALNFRTTSSAKVLGSYSFKNFSALTAGQINTINQNPFLVFEPSSEITKVGVINKGIQIGDIVYPNFKTAKKFASLLSEHTKNLIRRAESTKVEDTKEGAEANDAILKDLLRMSINEAEISIKKGKEPAYVVLALLEWRLKSLGLYYESAYVQKGSYLEASYENINKNRSHVLAEIIVDVFAEKFRIVRNGLERVYRPKITESFNTWVSYMRDAVEHVGLLKIANLLEDLQAIQKKLPQEQTKSFETYYLSRLMTNTRIMDANATSILAEFKDYMRKNYDSNIPVQSRVLLIPIDYIKNFDTVPESFNDYYRNYYFQNKRLFRGVSTPWKLSEDNVLEYFTSFKSRYSSEVSRNIYDLRAELVKLAMLEFNADLIEGRVVETAVQHATKHASYQRPNSAKTYFVSTTDLNTIAFRFAIDKGYISKSSSNEYGTTHMVFEFLLPKNGVVNFSDLKLTEPSWKNYYPRQREIAIAGGNDPNSVIRIYIIEPYGGDEKVPREGPEKHGKIVKIYERDQQDPLKINVKVRKSPKEWELIQVLNIKNR